MTDPIHRIVRGSGPIVATAIHDGHEIRPELMPYLALDEAGRLREEDPFTGGWARVAPTRVLALRSRFEVDINRPRETAVYRTPEDAWGLQVWKESLPETLVERSIEGYDLFYRDFGDLLREVIQEHGRVLVLDLHSYNHLREGPDGPAADPETNPQVNLGTGTIPDRTPWAGLIDRFISDLSEHEFPGGRLDVRENVKFRGGACAAWVHRNFPESACVLSVEFKKFFMSEWTGEPDGPMISAIETALRSTVPGILEELERI